MAPPAPDPVLTSAKRAFFSRKISSSSPPSSPSSSRPPPSSPPSSSRLDDGMPQQPQPQQQHPIPIPPPSVSGVLDSLPGPDGSQPAAGESVSAAEPERGDKDLQQMDPQRRVGPSLPSCIEGESNDESSPNQRNISFDETTASSPASQLPHQSGQQHRTLKNTNLKSLTEASSSTAAAAATAVVVAQDDSQATIRLTMPDDNEHDEREDIAHIQVCPAHAVPCTCGALRLRCPSIGQVPLSKYVCTYAHPRLCVGPRLGSCELREAL